MNSEERKKAAYKTWCSYHIPSTGNLNRLRKNVVYLNVHNDLEHELMKLRLAYDIRKMGNSFVTEAERNEKLPSGKRKVVDVVELETGQEFEVVFKHEDDSVIAEYRKEGVVAIIVNPMVCVKCGLKYPKRNEKGVCQLCARGKSCKDIKED